MRCGCLGGRGAGPVTATTRALRGSEIPSPPSAQSETIMTVLSKISGAYTHSHTEYSLETKQKCAALVTAALPPESRKCAKVCCPAPAKSKVYEKVYSVVSAMTRASLISNRIVVMSLVAFIMRIYIVSACVSGSGVMRQWTVRGVSRSGSWTLPN